VAGGNDHDRRKLVLTKGAATIVERRAPWREDFGPEWTLYWSDRNGRWHLYDLIDPTDDVRVLLNEVDRDPTCIFWG
jgi:hypothetical protein